MMNRGLCLALAVGYLACAQARADVFYCSKTADLEKLLAERYHEKVIAEGLSKTHNLIRIFRSDKSFTIMRTTPHGVSCIDEVGDELELLKPEIEGTKS
jgi:hypothetical protein